MSTVIENLERQQLRRVPSFDAGDRVRVHFQVIEGTRRRTQVFEGVVIARQGHGVREVFTVRKQSFGVGVERTFPLHSPKIERIEVAARGDVRRAKLYYLRGRVGKRARVRERRNTGPEPLVARELVHKAGEPATDAASATAEEAAGSASVAGAAPGATEEAAAAPEQPEAPTVEHADRSEESEPDAQGDGGGQAVAPGEEQTGAPPPSGGDEVLQPSEASEEAAVSELAGPSEGPRDAESDTGDGAGQPATG